MIVSVDPASPTPPYEQIRAQVAMSISTGVLAAGTRLPAIRQLAADLGLAGGTVARAYRELESSGLIVTRGRHGTHVATGVPTLSAEERAERLGAAAKSFAVAVAQLGMSLEDAVGVAREFTETTIAGPLRSMP